MASLEINSSINLIDAETGKNMTHRCSVEVSFRFLFTRQQFIVSESLYSTAVGSEVTRNRKNHFVAAGGPHP